MITAQSTAETLVLLAQLKAKEQELALVIADLRMPGGNGLDLLIGSRRFYPRAKRALLTAYADTDFAICAVNTDINRYILKPWDPPEEILYPSIDEMLQDWRPSRSDLFVGESRLMSGSASRGSGDAKDI